MRVAQFRYLDEDWTALDCPGSTEMLQHARDALLAAEELDPGVLDGSVYTSLGTLYYKVPGGFIGFGDRNLARQYLQKALQANPEGIDPNYFYAEFLYEEEEYAAARAALIKAQGAPARAARRRPAARPESGPAGC